MFIVAFLLILIGFMFVEALDVAVIGSVFLDIPFGDGWDAAWDHPGWLFAFALISMICRVRW